MYLNYLIGIEHGQFRRAKFLLTSFGSVEFGMCTTVLGTFVLHFLVLIFCSDYEHGV